ncbi:hypothetical protein, partial [Streptomyces aureus]|uniref:hypothetical protein n=1 Tax=Streptomyces aureus TaxID=193461 RepID=UPI003F5D5162
MSYAHQARPTHRDRIPRRRRALTVAAVATALTGVTGLAGGTAAAVPADPSAYRHLAVRPASTRAA